MEFDFQSDQAAVPVATLPLSITRIDHEKEAFKRGNGKKPGKGE